MTKDFEKEICVVTYTMQFHCPKECNIYSVSEKKKTCFTMKKENHIPNDLHQQKGMAE